MAVRDHSPLPLGPFKGVWDRGDPENVPLDHFERASNLLRKGKNWETRPGIGISQTVAAPIKNIKRAYNYPTATANTKIILVENDAGAGEIYHLVNESTIYGPLLTIAGMTDFAFVPYAGRAYISPFGTFQTGDINIQKGLDNEFLYVYLGDGTAARKAAGSTPAGTLTIANGAAGHTDPGLKVFGVVGETDTGYLSSPIALNSFSTSSNLSVSFSNIPVFVGAQWIKRHIVASISIPSFNGNLEGYQLFFIPGATVNDNVTTVLANQSFYDVELLEDAWHLLDDYSEIPAGCGLSIYHDRLVLNTTFDDISICLVSHPGEPEAIDQLTGLIIVTPDSNPITATQELRDVLYVGKRTKVISYTDNGNEPSTWPSVVIDTGRGWPVHGIGTVLDSGGTTVDYLIVGNFAGIMIFNGKFILPELSYKISNLWGQQDRNLFRLVQVAVLSTQTQNKIFVVLPDGRLLVGDYADGLDHKNICWMPLSFYVTVNCVLVANVDDIILGMDNPNLNIPGL